ncbi:MAG: GNAT family N-acetyltransferase [Actinomycetota bacterium]|nr:GNAT family N-acetyltransferase [Actinomycetota bacterium]
MEKIRQLVEEAFDGTLSSDDWEHMLGGWHVVILERKALPSHTRPSSPALEAAGRLFRTGYGEGVATAPGRRCEGLGSSVVSQVASLLRSKFELGALSTGRHAFYERLGWQRWRGPTFVRHADDLVRTEEDDDSVTVLRFGPSLALDLARPISCEARTGDHW